MTDLLTGLNPEQREAVIRSEGPLLVLAGAGSGKTRVIVHRIAHLIQELGLPTWSVLAVTFTNKAAGEMRGRLHKLVGEPTEARRGVWVSTFHSMGASILRREAERLGLTRSFTIYDDDDQIAVAKRVLREAKREADQASARDLLSAIDRWKNGVGDGLVGEETKEAIRRYHLALRAANAVDFGDLLALPLKLFEEHPDVLARYRQRFSHVLVDEFQDTNQVQYKLLKLLCPPPSGNLCVVGDDDQSIYRWRGADVGNILGFETDYPAASVVRLTQNYRSDGNILAAAAAVIAKNPHRHKKELWTSREAGAPLSVLYAQSERDEAEQIAGALRGLQRDGVSYGEMAVFFRINAQSRVLEEGLRVARLPYVIVRGRSFYERAEIKDALAYLRLGVNPRSDVDVLRVLNAPPRGIGDTTVERLLGRARAQGISLYDALAEEELSQIEGLNAGARGRLGGFRSLLDALAAIAERGSAAETAQASLTRSGMLERLAQQDTEESRERAENLMELVGAAREADERFAVSTEDASTEVDALTGELRVSPLLQFLEQVALIGDADGASGAERVSVMTLHAAKGLEFDAVIIAGLEEGVFPHSRALAFTAAPEEMHEERRLAYVGFTRARKRLFLSAARARALFGELRFNPPSRFLLDVPEALLDQRVPSASPGYGNRGFDRTSSASSGSRGDGYAIDRAYDQSVPASYGTRPASARSGARPVRPGRGVAEWNASRKLVTATRVESIDWPSGLAVQHPTFGLGRVLAAEGEGGDAKLTIRFRTVGDKRIVARFVTRAEG